MTPYLVDLGTSFSMIGVIGGSYGFSQMLLRIPLGVLSDRLGKRKFFLIMGLVAGTVSTFGMFFTQNAYIILTLRLLAGVSASAWVVFTVLFTDYFEKDKRASRMSYLLLANFSGIMLSRLFGGIIAEQFGHEYTYLLGGAAGVLAVILSIFLTEKTPQLTELPSVKNLIGVIKNKNLMAMSILAIFLQMVMQSTMNTFTPQAGAKVGADMMQLGLLTTIASFPAVITSIICGKLFAKKNLNVRLLLAFGFAIQVAGTFIMPFADTLSAVYVSAIVTGFGNGLCFSTLISFCTQTVDENRRSAAMGFFQAIYGFGMFIGPVIMGVFVDSIGLSYGFFTTTAFAVIGLVLTMALLKKPDANADTES
jgi:MFS family permease